MGRPKDEHYWNQVTKEENGSLKCKQCGLMFKGGVSRIKAHVDRIKGKGVRICSSIDHDHVQNNIIYGSNHSQEAINAMTPLQGWASMYVVNGSNDVNSVLESEISNLNQLVSDLTCEEGEVTEQLQWLESRGRKRKRQVDIWLNKVQELKRRAIVINDLQELQFGLTDLYGLEIRQLIEEVQSHKEQKPLVFSNEFVGKYFEKNIKRMWKFLKDDQVFFIGIHGMGGVGKTFLATYMENEINRKGTFKHVFWINVSHDFSIFKLQHDIAETIGVKLNRDDERTRATILSLALETREKTVIILDDVWKYIDLQKVGIPLKVNGIKLIITTRLRHVCLQMDCLPNNIIKIFPFEEEEEAWELFLLKLGHRGTPATLPPHVLEIARSVVMKCNDLPLGISVMARTMKGKNDIRRWRHALNNLEKSEMGEEMKEEVLTVLKRSYDNLIEKVMQNCFLFCALLPSIRQEELVMMLVQSGLLNGKRSLEEIFDEGHVIVDKLMDHCLLFDGIEVLRMHGLVRNMACHIMNQSHTYMVKCHEMLSDLPLMQEWTVDLEVVSLAGNEIEEIPEGTSPHCPRLSTLILSHNFIRHIPKCFFRHMNALTLLDLSENYGLTSLPKSLSKLRSLTSLVLRECRQLEYIPPLGDLQALSRLDISGCDSILRVPEGLQNLINLKWLDLLQNENSTVKLIAGRVLAGLSNMQYLDLRGWSGIKVEDVKGMTMLECFAGSFLDQDNYNRYVQEIQDTGYGPQTYIIYFGKFKTATPGFCEDSIYLEFKRRRVWFGDCDELPYLLPTDLAELSVHDNNQWECLCAALSSNGSLSLENTYIHKCTNLKSLFCLCCSLCTNIQSLKSLHLDFLESLTAICKEHIVDLTQSLSLSGVFSQLQKFYISECHAIETLLTPGLVPQLRNLKFITVWNCKSMKEIFAVSYSGGDDDDSFTITLPKLHTLQLGFLPQLKTVCKGILVCASENILKIRDCPNIEELHRIRRV
ncbi:hypothetical protein JHK82_051818 [Glycine max]|nr:hypothetical protein JHK82_051818 [Glycine max]KAG5096104.1 hypothetical protein JHK84_051692 [Glycine max]